MIAFYMILLSGVVGTAVLTFWQTKKKTSTAQEEKYKMNRLAENITINHFVQLLHKNPNITFDEAILDFENAEEKDLESFARRKCRTKRMYHKSYQKMFDSAIDIHYNNCLV